MYRGKFKKGPTKPKKGHFATAYLGENRRLRAYIFSLSMTPTQAIQYMLLKTALLAGEYYLHTHLKNNNTKMHNHL